MARLFLREKFTHFGILAGAAFACVWLVWAEGCSSAVKKSTPDPAPAPATPDSSASQSTPGVKPPDYAQVPHPVGSDSSDIDALFTDRQAPTHESLANCDADFKKLKSLVKTDDELRRGTRELVHGDPVKYHWCFYEKLFQSENSARSDQYLDERQKHVLDDYAFASPVARAFMAEYQDSRYFRTAVVRYARLSEWIFYRKLQLKPETTSELVDAARPMGDLRAPTEETLRVLDKYHLIIAAPEALPFAHPSEAPVPIAFPPAAPIAVVSPSPAPDTELDESTQMTSLEVDPSPLPSPAPMQMLAPVPVAAAQASPFPSPALAPAPVLAAPIAAIGKGPNVPQTPVDPGPVPATAQAGAPAAALETVAPERAPASQPSPTTNESKAAR